MTCLDRYIYIVWRLIDICREVRDMTTTKVERNESGAYLLDPNYVAYDHVKGFSRYNGGWIKRIDKIDKSKTNGYSLIGDFCKSGLQWMQPGIYLDCSKGGSRKNQNYIYTVFVLNEDGTVKAYNDGAIEVEGRGSDWAVRLWPVIEAAMAEICGKRLEMLRARKAELEAELTKVETEIKMLEEEVA